MSSFASISNLAMKMEATNDGEWSDKSYTLDKILKEFSPPLTVFVDEGYMQDENDSLAAGQVITILSQETLVQFKGFDDDNKRICIPVNCPFKVKLVSQFEGRVFNSIREISDATPRAKFVRMLSKGQKELANISKGDRLKILLSERDTNGPTFLHLRNQNGKHLRLSANFNGKFCECGENDEEYMLEDLVYRELPFYLKFVVSNEKSSISDLVGMMKITELANETLTFCTSYSNGKRFMAAFPINLDVKVRPAKLSKIDDKNSNELKRNGDRLQRLRESIYVENLVGDSQYIRFMPFEDGDTKQDQSMPTTELNCIDKMEEISDKNTADSEKMKDAKDPVINRNDPKRKSSGFLSKVKSKLRGGTKSHGNKAKQRRPEIVVLRDSSGACSDGGDSGIYEEIPGDTYVSMDVIDGIRRTLGRNSNTRVTRSIVSDTDAPPPLPANHPVERRHTVCMKSNLKAKPDKQIAKETQRDEENFRKFYESMRKSEQELKDFDIEDVAGILTKLKLNKYVKRFKESKIDGKLLVDLDEAVFKDMGMTPFESRKLRKYVFGWRPDKEGAMAFILEEFKDSFNAMLWNENEVEARINSLGMNEFAKFCKENQVNGDLLWDIVVDEEMLSDLLNGKDQRLNAIKLKNYVTEGWRPKISKKENREDGGIVKARSKSFNTGRRLQTGGEKNKIAKITSNYEGITANSRLPPGTNEATGRNATLVSKDSVKQKGPVSSRPRSATNKLMDISSETSACDNRGAKQKSASLYQKPISASYRKTVSPPGTNEPTGRNAQRPQTSSGYEIPVTRPASVRKTNTVSRQLSAGGTNRFGEIVKKSGSSKGKNIEEGKCLLGESRLIPDRKTITNQSSLSRKMPFSKLAPVQQHTNTLKPKRESSKVEVTKKSGGSRSTTPTSSTSSKGESPRGVVVHAVTRPKGSSYGKVSYPSSSPYGKKGAQVNIQGKGIEKVDSKQETKIKIGRKGDQKQTNDSEKQHEPNRIIKCSEPKELDNKNGRTADKETATERRKQSISCKNANSKDKNAPAETKPDMSGSMKEKEVKMVQKRPIFSIKKKNATSCAKLESKTTESLEKPKITEAVTNVMTGKLKKTEKQKSLQSSKEEKSSFMHRIKDEKMETKSKATKTDQRIFAKNSSRTIKEEDNRTNSNDGEIPQTRKSVAQLKKQFDRA